jgi:hypothetical protein
MVMFMFSFAGDFIIGLAAVDENWWQGQIDRQFGLFPLTHAVEVFHSVYSTSTNCKPQVDVTSDSPALQATFSNDQSPPGNAEASIQKSDYKLGDDSNENTNSNVLARAEALSDLTAQLDEELTFKAGEIIEITTIIDCDFAIGRCADGRSGHFPLGFVKVFEGSVNCFVSSLPKEQIRPKYDWWKDPNAAVKTQTAASGVITNSRPSFEDQTAPITPITVEEYSVNTSHKFYSNQITVEDEVFQTGVLSAFPSGCFVRALFQFVAENDNELSLLPGDIVNVIGPADEQWIEGEMGNRRGIFPMTFVELCRDDGPSEVHAQAHNIIISGESLTSTENASKHSLVDPAYGNEHTVESHESEASEFQEAFAGPCTVDTRSCSSEAGDSQDSVTTVLAPGNESSQSPNTDMYKVDCVDHILEPTADNKSAISTERGAAGEEDLKPCTQDQLPIASAADSSGIEAEEGVNATVENPPGMAGVSASKPSPTREKPVVSPKKLIAVSAKPEVNRPKPQLKPKPATALPSYPESKSSEGKQLSDSKPAVPAKRPAVPKKSAELRERLDMSTEAANASAQHGSRSTSAEVVRGDLRNGNGSKSSAAVPVVSGRSPEVNGDTGAGGIASVVAGQVPVPAARSDARYQSVTAERRPPRSVSFDEGVKTYVIDNGSEESSEREGRRCGNSTFYSDFETVNSSSDSYTTEPLKSESRAETLGRSNSRSTPVPPKRPNGPARSVTVEAAPRQVQKPQQPKCLPCRPAPPRPVTVTKKPGLSLRLSDTPESGKYMQNSHDIYFSTFFVIVSYVNLPGIKHRNLTMNSCGWCSYDPVC